jgi:cytochrome b
MPDDLIPVLSRIATLTNFRDKAMQKEIRVWDPLIRIFHWSLVLTFIVAYISGEEEGDIHIYSGYLILALIIFRFIWGVIGPRYARFSSFVYSPKTISGYLGDMIDGHPRRYLGHNPAGGAMVIVLLLSLVIVLYSGLKVYAIEEGAGPLALQDGPVSIVKVAYADNDYDEHGYNEYDRFEEGEDEAEEFWEEIHETFSNFVLLLVIIHIAGVIFSGRLHNENLVKAMITGKKKAE